MDLSNSPSQKCNCVQEIIYTFFYCRCEISRGGYQSKRGHQEMFYFLTSWTNTSQLIEVHPRAWNISELITQRGQLTPRKFEIEEKMTTKQIIKKGKQHQLHVMSLSQSCQYARKFLVIGEPHVKHSSSLPQRNINYLAVTKSNLYEKHSLCMWTLPKKIDIVDTWKTRKTCKNVQQHQEPMTTPTSFISATWRHKLPQRHCCMKTKIEPATPAKALEAPHWDTNYLRGTKDNFWRI